MKKRLMAIMVIALAAIGIFWIGKSGMTIREKQPEEEAIFTQYDQNTFYLWYTDDALTEYLASAAVAYNEEHGTRIVPVLQSGLNYIETINQSSIEADVPDLYVVSHDALQKAYLAGLAVETESPSDMQEAFMAEGIRAATYKDKVIGYPFYFETSILLYNETYLADMAKKALEQDRIAQKAEQEAQSEDSKEKSSDETKTEEASDGGEAAEEENAFSEEEISAKVQEYLPSTIEDIREFADLYDAPEQVESVFKWDVTDIFYNYFFIGSSIDMGGECGWDTTKIDIYNRDAIESMKAYQNLNNFFSIDTSEISYDSTIQDFMDGKVVFTIATSDAVARLEQAKADGTFVYDYGVLTTPSVKEGEVSSSLSMTNCIAVNGYSKNQKTANDFAWFLCTEYNDILYDRAGKVSAEKNMEYPYDALQVFASEYETSVSMPKMLETNNYWLKLEASFAEIWNGADANEELKALSEQIKYQVTGEAVEEAYIEDEEDTGSEAVEYLDEEYYRQQALENE